MKAAMCTGYFELFTPEDAVQSLMEAGFVSGELAADHSTMLLARGADVEKTGLAFRALLADNGFAMPQGHLDFQNDLTTRQTVEALKREITMFQAIGVQHAVFHINGGADLPEEVRLEKQFRHLQELLEFVQGTDFTFCLENLMTNPTIADADKLLQWIDRLGGKNLGICLDTGHLHRSRLSLGTTDQTHVEFIKKAGKCLKALHIHSNDGKNDLHLAPFTSRANNIDWVGVIKALREIGYDGLFNLEVPGETESYPPVYVLKQKLLYLKDLTDYMLSEEFSNFQYYKGYN